MDGIESRIPIFSKHDNEFNLAIWILSFDTYHRCINMCEVAFSTMTVRRSGSNSNLCLYLVIKTK